MRFFKRNINLTHHFRQLVNLIVLIIKRLEKKYHGRMTEEKYWVTYKKTIIRRVKP